ncbi:MAG TPA: YceI family protein [Solirubrobacterales bacterium]|nr:YceI family protein [Solirubrobacterales bacterium]
MPGLAVHPFTGLYRAQPAPSTFAFAVRHSGTFWFRGSLPDVAATLRADGDALALEGSARVDSISVVEPAAMRASVLGPEFFDAERHSEVTFGSTEIRLADDGQVEVEGELTMKGITRPVSATGRYSAPRQATFGEIAGLQLATTIDRREFGFDWQMELPDGGVAVGWDVQVDIDLLLIREDTAGEG